jgi:hypothetical protein
MAPSSIDTIQHAWESFQATGTCDETVVAPPILRAHPIGRPALDVPALVPSLPLTDHRRQ